MERRFSRENSFPEVLAIGALAPQVVANGASVRLPEWLHSCGAKEGNDAG